MALPTQIIAGAAGTIVPTIVMQVTAQREAGNIVHTILGNAVPDVTLRPAALRKGVLQMGFAGATAEADSQKALDIHALGVVLTLLHADRPSASMNYVTAGRIERELEDATRDAWIVRVDYQEVRPR